MGSQSNPIPLKDLGPTPLNTSAFPTVDSFTPQQSSAALNTGTLSAHPDDVESPTNYIPVLPPVDTGREAWSFLIAATVLETLIWGIPYTVGVFHEYWTSTLFEGKGESTITLAATLQTGLMYMSVAIFQPLIAAYAKRMREIQSVCLFIAGIALISSAFVTKPWHLIVTIGILYPFAGASYLPAATLLFEWFQAKRGLASGIMYAGTGAGGAVFPLIIDPLLRGVGYKATMIGLGIGFIIIGHACLFFIKRRIPLPSRADPDAQGRRTPNVDWSFLKRSTMFAGTMTIFVTSLGNFVPNVWLPTFAKDLNLTKPGGTGLVSILNAASVPGLTLLGFMTDRLPLFHVLCTSCVGASLTCFLLWGFGTTDAMLVTFVLAFGLLGVSFTALWSKMITVIARDDPALPQYIFVIFAFFRGIGNISSGPISDALLKLDVLRGKAGAYGVHNYGVLLLYTGVTILLGAVTGIAFRTKKEVRSGI